MAVIFLHKLLQTVCSTEQKQIEHGRYCPTILMHVPREVLKYISNREEQRPFLGLKLAILAFFWGGGGENFLVEFLWIERVGLF